MLFLSNRGVEANPLGAGDFLAMPEDDLNCQPVGVAHEAGDMLLRLGRESVPVTFYLLDYLLDESFRALGSIVFPAGKQFTGTIQRLLPMNPTLCASW